MITGVSKIKGKNALPRGCGNRRRRLVSKPETVRLGDVCKVVSGTTPKTNVPEYWDGTLNWVTPAEINDDTGIIYETVRKISEAGVHASSLKSFPAGTVILSSRAPIGKVAIAGTEMYCNQGFKNLVCSDKIFNRYLFRYLKGQKEYLNSLGRGATFKEISKAIVENIPIPLPSISTQQQIAAILDKVSDLIAERTQQLEKIDLLVKSLFIEIFGDPVTNDKGWDIKRLDQIADSRLGKMLDSKRQTGNDRYPYLANFNVQWFRFDLEKLNEMDFNEADRSELALEYGDLLVCEGGEVGRTAIWKNEQQDCFFQKAIHRVRCRTNMCIPEYLAWVMYQKAMNTNFDGLVTSATIAHLTGVKLKGLQIQVPPLPLQNRFADFVRAADKSKIAINQGLKTLELQSYALMQKYFG